MHVILLDFMFREKSNTYSEAPHYKIFSILLSHSQTHNVLLKHMNTKLETSELLVYYNKTNY
jgi:hypothetical protein